MEIQFLDDEGAYSAAAVLEHLEIDYDVNTYDCVVYLHDVNMEVYGELVTAVAGQYKGTIIYN